MKFSLEYTDILEQRELLYNAEEYSFDTEPSVQEVNFDILLNNLNLTVVDENNKIVQIWGFCSYLGWIRSNYNVPWFRKGVLKVIDNLEAGVGSYRVNSKEFPIYVNLQTGWLCIGNPDEKGYAVEFINNCVAVVDSKKDLVSLWLKPKSLPQL